MRNTNLFRWGRAKHHIVTGLALVLSMCFVVPGISQVGSRKPSTDDQIPGVSSVGELGVQRVTAEIMDAQISSKPSSRPVFLPRRVVKGIEDKAPNPDVQDPPFWKTETAFEQITPSSPQVPSTSFTGATLADTAAFPPDSMGTVGPTQFVVFVNGRIRTFNKTTGVADGVINANPDIFFAPVMTPVVSPVLQNFTTDPQVRYDRLSGRWILSIIDVPCTTSPACTTTTQNRWLVAVSDAASAGTISGSTVWTLFFVQTDAVNFCDYPSLGVDSQALYFGCNMFNGAGTAFLGTNGYVVRKTSVLGAGPIFSTAFAGLAGAATEGPFSPRGVDNYDPLSNEGYFIGVSNTLFSQLDIRRVSTPGGTPTISANILLTVPTTTLPNPVTHLGNTGGNNGRLDSLDDRLYAAHIRGGRLWTAHNFRVSAAGVANTAGQSRNAVRWYELNGIRSADNGGVPVVVQSGTIFDNAALLANARQFWIPSVMVSGQGHAAMAFSTAGTPFRADAATVGRLAGDALGTTQTVNIYTASSTAYNPPSDPGGSSGRRWGDYSYTSLDPLDDMTMWTIQEFCDAANSYGVRAVKLLAPLPATPTSTNLPGGAVSAGLPSVNVVVTGTSAAGSGFFDPGANLSAPALPFTHISASISGGVTVNSVTYNSPTQVTLNISTVGASGGAKNITVTNPDGQSATGVGIFSVLAPTAAGADLAGRVVGPFGRGISRATVNLMSADGSVNLLVFTNSFGYYRFVDVPTGVTYVIVPTARGYTFSPSSIVHTHLDEFSDGNFVGNTR